MFASSKLNGSSVFGRIRSTFQQWKNSCATVPSAPAGGALDRDRGRDDGAVAMLHAVAAAPRHVVAEERVRAGLEVRELAEDRAFLVDDLLDARAVLVDVGVGRVVMHCRPDSQLLAVGIADLERPDRLRAQLRRAVHQVLEVRRGERPASRSERAASPASSARSCGGSNVTRTGRTSSPRAHISVAGMFMCACVVSIAEVRAVDAIAEHLVDDADGAVVAGDVPLGRIRAATASARCPCRRRRERRRRSSRTRARHSVRATIGSCAPASGPAGNRGTSLRPAPSGAPARERDA